MPRRYRRRCPGQAAISLPSQPVGALARALLPLARGVESAKQNVLALVHDIGLGVVQAMLGADAEKLVGVKGKHQADRTTHHWGSTPTQLPLGGRRIRVNRPRVRGTDGHEVTLPILDELQAHDPMPERIIEHVLLGVSTRGYGRSLEPLSDAVEVIGTSKSAVSRKLVEETAAKTEAYLSRRLEDVELVALVLDGIHVADKAIIVALGITKKGVKEPFGMRIGSTENAEVCTALLQDLIDRGLKIEERILAVIDGAKGLRRALRDVFGDRVVVQRCQLHKMRNVVAHLPERRHNYVRRGMRDAYRDASATQARKKLQALASWLERNGEDGAAASLKEGLEETLTVVKFGLSGALRRFFSTTNAVENLVGSIRRVSRNVKRWREGGMIGRWCALGLVTAQKRFRRIKGYAQLADLVRALKEPETDEREEEKAA